jgi:DNA (cytosine-5)-methyltransferase 1
VGVTSLKVVDVFCGAGGLSEGFKMAGFEVLLGIDSNPVAIETFKKNNPGAQTILGDVSSVSEKMISDALNGAEIDVVVGGPPCQGFSTANRRKKTKDVRNRLYKEFLRVVGHLKPQFFVMENVRGIQSAKNEEGKSIMDDIRETMHELGYNTEYRQLLAADFGVPQLRRRVFCIGRKGERAVIQFPEKTHSRPKKSGRNGALKKWVGLRGILLPRSKAPAELFYSKKLIRGFKRRERENKKRNLGFRWQFLNPARPSYTIPARYYKDGANALVKYKDSKIRKLDAGECARIQTFPDDYQFAGSKKQVYSQIGNAVPPLMAKRIAQGIKGCLDAERRGCEEPRANRLE